MTLKMKGGNLPANSLQLLQSNQLLTYLYGWKSLASYFGITVRTLQRWNKDLKIPWEKNYQSQQARVKIHLLVADEYYRLLQKIRNVSLKSKPKIQKS